MFGAILFSLLWLMNQTPPLPRNPELYQLVNIAFGALTTAFATVVAFWLGSSTGSRVKDVAIIEAEEKRQVAETKAAVIKARTESSPPVASDQSKPKPDATLPGTRFERCMDIVFEKEGGFSDHPKDKGGATLYGITLETFRSWKGDDNLTAAELKAMTKEEAKEIYRSSYWNAMNCDKLPPGVDLIVFDFGVNAGPGRSAKILQKVVGAEADGSIGPATLSAVKTRTPRDIIIEMSRKRLEHYKGLSNWSTFGDGWTNRTNAIEDASLKMAEA
jgi:hypothetical protein